MTLPELEAESATSDLVAPEGQPTDGAVEGENQEPTQPPDADSTETAETGDLPPLLAGKYTSTEELVKGYQNATSEASRLAAELAGYRKGVEAVKGNKPETTAPEYTPDQLKSWKTGHLAKLADAQAAKRLAMKDGDYETARKFEEEAATSANQISLIDDKLRELDMTRATRASRQEGATHKVMSEAQNVLRKYQSQLVDGTPLNAKATELWQHYLDMGHADNAVTQAQAVLLAAELVGAKPSGDTSTRKTLTNSIKSALKQGVVAGAGKAKATTGTNPDFMAMSDQEFIAYKRERGWD